MTARLCNALIAFALLVLAPGTLRAEVGTHGILAAPMVTIPGGTFMAGDPEGEPDEAPRRVTLSPFRMMELEVTQRQFTAFVAQSGRVTDAEENGFGFVWDGRWRRQPGATWRRPNGPEAPVVDLGDHPVVQVSADDAAAFCNFYGLRLPSDPEWEFAARGSDGRRYPWGNAPAEEDGRRRANFGTVPCCAPDAADGFLTTAPVGSYPDGRSPFGLWDMAGNVWEWTSSAFPGRPDRVSLRGGGWGNNPYCLRTSYRHQNPFDIGLDMVGFRCAADPP